MVKNVIEAQFILVQDIVFKYKHTTHFLLVLTLDLWLHYLLIIFYVLRKD